MKKYTILILIILSAFYANAQHVLDESNALQFIESSVMEINEKCWDAAISKSIPIYANDSLKSPISPDSLMSIYNAHNPKSSDPYQDLIGLWYVFEPEWDFEKGAISYNWVAIAPTLHASISGIDLGILPVFMLKKEDLEKVFSKEDFEFIKALMLQRSVLGDFRFRYLTYDWEAGEIGESMSYTSAHKEKSVNDLYPFMDSVMANYQLGLLSNLMRLSWNHNRLLFQDSELKLGYKNIEWDLASTIDVPIPNPDNPDDPYDLISQAITVTFQLDKMYDNFRLHKVGNERIVELVMDRADGKKLFFSYTNNRLLLSDFDRIVLDRWFNSL